MKMRAAIFHGVENISLEEVEKPELIPGSIIIKNVRSGICGTDLHAYERSGEEVGIYPENQFGHEMSGVIDELGEGVTGFKKGQHVFINPCTFKEPTPEMSVLMCCDMAGAFSEYIRVDKPVEGYNVFPLSDTLSWDIAAMIEPLSVAMHGIERCNPQKGDKALIYGGGIIGLCALACLKCLGIDDVIVTARNPFRSQKIIEMGGILCDTGKSTVPEFVMNKWGKLTGNNGEDTWDADLVIETAGYRGVLEEIMQYAKCGSSVNILALGVSQEKVTETNIAYKDISIQGTFAYTPETNKKVIEMVTSNEKIFAPIATSTYGLSDVKEAFEAARDHKRNVKVLIDHSK